MKLTLSIDAAVERAFHHRKEPLEPEEREYVREIILAEIERLEELDTFEARFTVPIIQGLADDLYRPNLNNAAID